MNFIPLLPRRLRVVLWVSGLLGLVSPSSRLLGGTMALDRLHHWTQSLAALESDFTQANRNKAFGTKRSRSGRLIYVSPNQLRWEYFEPPARTFLADGKKLWVWELNDQKKVSRVFQQTHFKMEDAPLTILLAGSKDAIRTQYTIEQNTESELHIKPKQADARLVRLKIVFASADSPNPERVVIEDQMGNTTQIEFQQKSHQTKSSWINQSHKSKEMWSKQFQFYPPKGVEVLKIDDASDFLK